jgi:hypothetical protein
MGIVHINVEILLILDIKSLLNIRKKMCLINAGSYQLFCSKAFKLLV